MTTRKPKPRRRFAASSKCRLLPAAATLVGLVLVASVPAASQTITPILRELRIHGNYSTPDAEIIRLAGLTVGEPLGPSSVEDARVRLERSGRFVSVDVRKRYRSLDDESDVAIILVVQEYPVPEATPSVLRPLQRTFHSTMFMPVLNFTDGYGFTYGGRVSFVDGFGRNARLSVPLTWGGTKQAAAQFEKTIANGPVDRITAAVSVSRCTNPHYELDDDRRDLVAGVSRTIAGPLRAEGHAGWTSVTFGDLDNTYARYGAGLTLDTRADPVFPRNAILASASWERLDFHGGVAANRLRLDTRGYLGLIGQAVLSLRLQFAQADQPLPPYERFLLGGADSLRGYRAGTFTGDTLAAASAELRVPVSSPLSFARAGVDIFSDVGAAVDRGVSLGGASFHPGFGGGVFLFASVFQINLDVAVRRGGGARVHLMSGFRF